ncbi:MAG: carbamate kinase [Acidobacteria bacterium]|nr:carbamate kinase [Acidobacteriota bacterium]
MRIAVVAIGGNSLVPPGSLGTLAEQRRALELTCEGIAAVLACGYRLVVTHGNGPQVGDAWRRSELAAPEVEPLPLDLCVAETQGSIGCLLQQTLEDTLRRRRLERPVATIITQVLVSPNDPAFAHPTKPVGPFYTREEAGRRRAQLGWQMVEEVGRGYRRVVASPQPQAIVEFDAIQAALARDVAVIAAGGGGVPVVRTQNRLQGAEAVIDKDRASALLATQLGAELLLISTRVDEVYLNYATDRQQPLPRLTLEAARRYLAEGHFPPGNMGPKIEAAADYLERGGRLVIITSPQKILLALEGVAGTRITSQAQYASLRLRPAA